MSRGYSNAQSERLSRSVNAVALMAKDKGIDPSSMTLGEAEKYVLALYNAPGARGRFTADKTTLKDEYGEQASEMRYNDMRPPSYSTWVKNKVAMALFSEKLAKDRADFEATPEGASLRATKDAAYKVMMEKYENRSVEVPYEEQRKRDAANDVADKALRAAQSRWERENNR
jgi:hypothetical protein